MARYCTRPAVSEGRHHLVSDHKWMLHSIVQWLSEEHSQAGRTISRFKPESPFRELRKLKAQFQFVGRSLIIRPLRRQRMPALKRHKYIASYIIISYVLKTENHYMKLYKTPATSCKTMVPATIDCRLHPSDEPCKAAEWHCKAVCMGASKSQFGNREDHLRDGNMRKQQILKNQQMVSSDKRSTPTSNGLSPFFLELSPFPNISNIILLVSALSNIICSIPLYPIISH